MEGKIVKAGVVAAAAALAAGAAGMFGGTALAGIGHGGGSIGDNFGVRCAASAPIQVGILLGLTGDNYSCNRA